MVSLSPYSTLLDLSNPACYQGNQPHSIHLHGNQAASNASGEYVNVGQDGQVDSLEGFHRFKNGYSCTSSQQGSLETMADLASNDLERSKPSNGILWTQERFASDSAIETSGRVRNKDEVTNAESDGANTGDQWDYLTIQVTNLPLEQRFGFSVIGGCDEGFAPRVDNIFKGSPADRADLQVGDEIVEVNGRSLAQSTHADVISYIHKCIRSKAICLRVRRKKDNQQVSVPKEDIQNAYIVAVEEDAKRRLEELVYNRHLTPIDMTQNIGDDTLSSTEDLLSSSNSIANSTLSVEQAVYKSPMPYSNRGQMISNGHVEMSDMTGYKENEHSRKGKGEKGKKGKRSKDTETPLINNLLTERQFGNSVNSLNKSSMDDSFSDMNSVEDLGPHREMAIDVPADFLGAVKTPPKYPSSISSSHSSPRSHRHSPLKSAENSKHIDQSNNMPPPNQEQIERIRRHQEEIRKRTEREEQKLKEEEFLRASLRGSRKMRALASKSPQIGVENRAYSENDDDSGGFEEGYVSGRQTQNSRDYMRKNLDYDDILGQLKYFRREIHTREGKEKLKFLTDFVNNKVVQDTVQIHKTVLDAKTCDPPVKSTCCNCQDVQEDSVELLKSMQHPHASELTNILGNHQLKGLLLAHDLVATQQARSGDEQPPDEFNNVAQMPAGGSIKIVHLDKTAEPLGATVKNEGESVIISRIVKGGTADKSGLLNEGDEILDIDGVDMKGKTIDDVSEMLADMTGTITFTIYPNSECRVPVYNPGIMHVKALFNYDPEEDLYIPCRELGLSFLRADILHVINQQDTNWWQAYREGEEDYQTLAGLIPSKAFHEQREALTKSVTEDKENQKKQRSCSCGRTNRKKKRKYNKQQDDNDEILSYEEMIQYYPEPNRRRPIVLIGPPNVGRHELRQRMMESDFDRFAAAVPHTSRTMKVPQAGEETEVDGKDYHFVSFAEFQADIIGGRFVEHGNYEKNLYGTSIDAIRQVINNGKICVLNTDPEALYILKNTDLKPYIVFVYPPNMEKLRQIHQKLGMTDIKDEVLTDIIERAREMDHKFGHFFDFVLVNSDMDKAFDELLVEINRIEVEPQWVPKIWMR